MTLTIELTNATYLLYMEGQSLTLDCKALRKSENGKNKGKSMMMTDTLGYFGAFQLDLAFKRIITEELSRGEDTTSLEEFVARMERIEAIILAQIPALVEQIKESRAVIKQD